MQFLLADYAICHDSSLIFTEIRLMNFSKVMPEESAGREMQPYLTAIDILQDSKYGQAP